MSMKQHTSNEIDAAYQQSFNWDAREMQNLFNSIHNRLKYKPKFKTYEDFLEK